MSSWPRRAGCRSAWSTRTVRPRGGSVRLPAAVWPDGSRSSVDQVCLDISPAAYDEECAFWAALTGWKVRPSPEYAEFRRLWTPSELPLRLLLQRLDEPQETVAAHVDLACGDRAAETDPPPGPGRGARPPPRRWTVLRDPAGAEYCLTDRTPVD